MLLRAATATDLQLVQAAQKGDHDLVVGLLHLGASPWAEVPGGFSALHAAARKGSLQAVQALLQRGAFVNALANDGSTALNLAAQQGHTDVMGVLLTARADVTLADKKGSTPLHAAAGFGHTDMMQRMLDAGAAIDAADSQGCTPLHNACVKGQRAAAQLLVARGASLEAACKWSFTALHTASQQGHLELVQLLLDANASLTARTKYGKEPLYLAAAAGHHAVVQLLLSRGARPTVKDDRGCVALHAAANNNQVQAVQFLLEADSTAAHVDAQGPEGTPLHMACLQGGPEVVALLIKAGADVNARTPAQRTPLHQAVITGKSAVVEQLLAAGADPCALTRTGANGVHVAAMRGYSKIIKQLLAALGAEQGSEVLETPYDGKTPLQHAVESKETRCIKVLLAAGADPDRLYGAEAAAGGRSLAGASTLHRAAQLNCAAAVPLLATPRNMRRLWKGQTALHLALALEKWPWMQTTDTSAAQALVAAGAPVGLANAAGATPMSLAASNSDAAIRALLPGMVRQECGRYKQLQQGGKHQQRQQGLQDEEEEGVEEQDPAAVLASVFAAVNALLETTAAAGEASSHDPLLGCFRSVLEVLGEEAAGRLLQQLLSKGQARGDAQTAAPGSSRALLLYKMFVKAWLAELQPLLDQRWDMTNRLEALVTHPLQPQPPKPRRRPVQLASYSEHWALSQSAVLAAQASAAAAAGCWEMLVLLLEQLAGIHEPSAQVVLYILEQEQQDEGARDLSGMCHALLSAWAAAQQQVAVRKQRELAQAVVLAVQAAHQQAVGCRWGRGRR